MLDQVTGFQPLPPPAAGWAKGPRKDQDDEPIDKKTAWRIERQAAVREIQALLGVVMKDTTVLIRPGSTSLTAYDRHGHQLTWSLWAPYKSVIVDIFRRSLPSNGELEDRHQFAQEHNLRYGIVEPGKRLTIDALRSWLNGEED